MTKKHRLLLCFLLMLFSSPIMNSQSQYYTYLNDFNGLKNHDNEVRNNILIESNYSSEIHFSLIDFDCKNSEFTISMKIANKSNLSGKSFKVYDNNDKFYKITNPIWGFVWNYKDRNNYQMIRLKGHNTLLHDILDERSLIVDVLNVSYGNIEIVKTLSLNKGVNLYDGYNSIWLKYDGNNTYLYIGDDNPILIDKINISYDDSMKTGYFVGSGSMIELERFITKKNIIKERILLTKWNRNNLNDFLKSDSIGDIEGLWTYFDRNIDETKLKLGGKYKLVIAKNKNGCYDLLYYSGAVVNNLKWTSGMLKGRLSPTRFKDNYDLVWYDSVFEELNDDTYATIEENGNIMTLYFPKEKGQIRFVKQK